MSLWNQLVQLPPEAFEKLQNIYGNSFPLEIRQYLSGYLEAQLINNTQTISREQAGLFFSQLLEQIKIRADSLPLDNFTVKFRLLDSATKLRQIYESDPIQLYTHLCSCIEFERKLLANPLEQISLSSAVKSDNSAMDITQALMKLRDQVIDSEKENRDLKREYENFCLFLDHLAKQNSYYDEYEMKNPESSTQFAKSRQELNNHLMVYINRINSMRIGIIEKFSLTLNEVEKIQKTVNDKFLCQWIRDQKCAAVKCVGSQANPSQLDLLQGWFERQAEILWKIHCEIKNMQTYRNQANLAQYEQSLPDNLPELQRTTIGLLEKLIVSSFVIEKQPAQIIIQERNGGKRFSSTLRVLIGNALNTGLYNTMVKVSIISEAQAKAIKSTPNEASYSRQAGEIVNCVGNLEYNPATNHLSSEFKNMQLKPIKRSGSEDKVVDEKFALFFQAKINVGEMVFGVWAMSLPVVVISHAKQQIDALATVVWDNAFSDLYRRPFDELEKVKWSQLSEILNLKFTASTGRGLTSNNLHFLCEKLVRRPLQHPISGDLEISRNQFCRDIIGTMFSHEQNKEIGFTFWTWFYKALELTHDHLKELWCDGLIAGFINKMNTDYYLYNCPPGTFLLRFSESILGGLVISWVANLEVDRIKHLSPFVKQEFARKSLPNYLRDMNEMITLFIDEQVAIPKYDAFGRYMTISVNGEHRNTNYVQRDFRVTYEVENSSGSRSQRELELKNELDAILDSAITDDEMFDVGTSQFVLDGLNFNSSPDQQNLPAFLTQFSNITLSPTSSY